MRNQTHQGRVNLQTVCKWCNLYCGHHHECIKRIIKSNIKNNIKSKNKLEEKENLWCNHSKLRNIWRKITTEKNCLRIKYCKACFEENLKENNETKNCSNMRYCKAYKVSPEVFSVRWRYTRPAGRSRPCPGAGGNPREYIQVDHVPGQGEILENIYR